MGHAERQAGAAADTLTYVKELQDRVHTLELGTMRGGWRAEVCAA